MDLENPFCTRRVRPGALPFLFTADQSLSQLLERLEQSGWWGQIVGPHGCGKSTLLASLIPAIERAGCRALLFELHDGCRRLPLDYRSSTDLAPPALLIIDGYEQLSRWSRYRLKRFCRRRGLGLLVTSHESVGLPELLSIEPDLRLARQIVDQVGQGFPPHVNAEDVAERFSQRGGNLRETLFDLYDIYEKRRRFRPHDHEE